FVNLLLLIENHRLIVFVDVHRRCSESVERLETKSVAYRELIRQNLLNFNICSWFKSVFAVKLTLVESRICTQRLNRSRIEFIVNRIDSELHIDFFRQITFQIVLNVVILDAGIVLKSDEIQIESVVIIAVDKRQVREKFIGKQMVPAHVQRRVSVDVHETSGEVEHVAPEITRCIQTVVVVEFVIEFHVEIVEVRGVFDVGELQQKVSVRCASAEEIRTAVFHDRPFGKQSA